MSTSKQDRDFTEALGLDGLLESAAEWIGKNMEPDDVFDKATLEAWAETNGYLKE